MKGKFVWLILSCLMVAALVLASCGAPAEKKDTGGTLTSMLPHVLTTFDPFDGVAPAGFYINSVLDSLVIADYWRDHEKYPLSSKYDFLNEEIWEGSLAESWEQPDNLTIIFKLRKGVKWQDRPPLNGREFVASDVKWDFDTFLSLPKYSSHILQNIKSITTPDKYTVVFKFKEPNVAMLERIAARHQGITAPDVSEQLGWDARKEFKYLIGTGPFYVTGFVPDSSVTYTKNDNYFGKDPDGNQLPYIDSYKILILTDTATRMAALRTGKIDITAYEAPVPWNQKPGLEKTNPDLQWAASPDGGVWSIWLRSSYEPFQDRNVRKAMSMVVNRQEMVDTLLGGSGIAFSWPARYSWPEFTPLEELPADIREIYEWKPENVAKAKQLLTDAGYPNGFQAEYVYNIQGSKYEPLRMEVIQAYWKEIGVDVTLRPVDRGTASSLRSKPFPYKNILGCGGGQSNALELIDGKYRTDGSFNRAVIADSHIDDLYYQAAQEFDYAKRTAILKELYLHIAEQAYDVSMPVIVNWMAWQPWVKGYHGETNIGDKKLGALWGRIWIDEELKKEKLGQ